MNNYVTHEELDKLLRGYEKIGSIEDHVTKLDSVLRKFLNENIELFGTKTKAEMDLKITSLTQKFEATLKASMESSKVTNMREIIELCKAQIESQSKNILNETLSIIDKKSKDIRNNVEDSVSSKLISSQKESENVLNILKREIYSNIMTYQEIVENLCATSIQKAIDSHRSTLETLVNNVLSDQYKQLVAEFVQMKVDIQMELTQKVVDKKFIEDKMSKLENDLLSKTQETINFQIDQSRAMMEQSARAEISDSLKQASNQMLNSLL